MQNYSDRALGNKPIADAAIFRYRHYHTPEDTPDKLDYDRMARMVSGLENVIGELANP